MNISTTSVVPCFSLTSEEQLQYNRINTAHLWISYYIPIAINIAGIAVNFSFLFFVIKGMYQNSLTSKIYLFMVNKSVGDLLASIANCTVLLIELKHETGLVVELSEAVELSIEIIAGISYWSASLTFLALSLVKYLAIQNPLLHRRKMTSRLIIKVLLALWPVAILLAASNPNLYLLISQNETCLQYIRGFMAILNTSLHAFFFLLVLITCSTVLFLAYKHKTERVRNLGIATVRDRQPSGQKSMQTSNRIMLAGFIIYSICYFFTVTYYIIHLIFGGDLCKEKGAVLDCESDQQRSFIKFYEYYVYFLVMVWFLSLRSVIDPAMNILIDRKLRNVIKI
jgi:hypothetical protein